MPSTASCRHAKSIAQVKSILKQYLYGQRALLGSKSRLNATSLRRTYNYHAPPSAIGTSPGIKWTLPQQTKRDTPTHKWKPPPEGEMDHFSPRASIVSLPNGLFGLCGPSENRERLDGQALDLGRICLYT